MRTLIIDNYIPNSPQIERLYNIIKDVTVHTVQVVDYSTLSRSEEFKNFDVIILSGSQRKLAEPGIFETYAVEAEIIKVIEKPMLGICFGHQLLAMAHSEPVRSSGKMLEGYYMVRRLEQDEIFEGLPEKFLVFESHEEYIEAEPYDFIKLADSPNCLVEAIKHRILPKYGVQFHPERFDDKHPAGIVVLENFFKLASWYVK